MRDLPATDVDDGHTRSDGGLQVVRRAAVVLRAIGDHGGGLRLTDLAHHVDLPKTTIHRVVNALATERLLQIDDGGRIWLGTDLALLSRAAVVDLAARIRPALVGLHRSLDETVDVSVLEGASARFIDQLAGTKALRVVSAVGATFPLHATANGKALLAGLAPVEAHHLLAGPLERYTPNTTVEGPVLEAELDLIRHHGIAVDQEEHTLGICAAGAAVIGPDGPILAISVPVPTDRFTPRRDEIVAALRSAVGEASRLLDLA